MRVTTACMRGFFLITGDGKHFPPLSPTEKSYWVDFRIGVTTAGRILS